MSSRLIEGLILGCLPDGQTESNLVDKVGEVVDEVQAAVIDATHEVAKEVAGRIDGPACSHNQAHGCERGLHVLVCRSKLASHSASLTTEDLEQDEEPSTHAAGEANPCTTGAQVGLSGVAEDEHHHGANQKLPERALGDILAHCGQNEIELNHLQWHSDGPVDVPVENWGSVNQHPELTHVEVVHSSDKGHEGTHIHGCFPVCANCSGLHEEEHSGCHHRDGDDPERDCNGVIWVEEAVQVQSHFVQRCLKWQVEELQLCQ